jgi:hypothetical protein
MTTPQNVLDIAKVFINLEEVPENLTPFGRWYSLNGQPWCAMFVSFCTYVTGMPLPITIDKGFAYCPFGVNWFKEQGRWYPDDPHPGDIVFYDWLSSGEAEHTGLVESVHDSYIMTIEGNTSDQNDSNGGMVQRRERQRNYTIIGYGRPPYDGKDIGQLAKDVPPFHDKEISLSKEPHSSPDVLLWKQQMLKRGWKVAEPHNSAFTSQDKELLTKFQREMFLEQDGILGLQSWLLTWLEPITSD